MKVGDKKSTSCLEFNCTGWLNGTYGGTFHIGDVEYTQIMNCECDRCGVKKSEVFECWNERLEEFWVTEHVTIPLSDDCDMSFPGLGIPAAEADPYHYDLS